MASDAAPRSARWRHGSTTRWSNDERGYAALLDALTRDLAATEATGLELDAGPRRSLADVQEEQERLEHDQLAESRRELEAFRAALQDARARSGPDGQAEVAYDAASPEQDEMADLLIQYLVRPDYAEVRTQERESGHHVYYIKVAWDRLRDLAELNGHPLAL